MSREFTLILVASVLSIVGGYSDLFISDDLQYTNFWMLCNSIGWFLLSLALWYCIRKTKERIYVMGVVILCFSEVLDEIFWSPNTLQWNDIFFLIATSIYVLISLKRCKMKRV